MESVPSLSNLQLGTKPLTKFLWGRGGVFKFSHSVFLDRVSLGNTGPTKTLFYKMAILDWGYISVVRVLAWSAQIPGFGPQHPISQHACHLSSREVEAGGWKF